MSQENVRALLADLEPLPPEKQIKVHKDATLERLLPKTLKLYEKLLSQYEFDWPLEFADEKANIWKYWAALKFVPTPNVILEFMLRLADYEDKRGFAWVTGQYISALVGKSHSYDNNNFQLEFRHLGKTIDYVLGFVCPEERPLRVSVFGNVGRFCGLNAKNLRLTIRGDVGGQLAYGAKDSKFKIFGETDLGAGWCAENSVFKCTDKESAERISTVVREDCKVYWLKNGKKVAIK